ncbi:cytochrome P450 monooxygenase [Sparassis latifolia]
MTILEVLQNPRANPIPFVLCLLPVVVLAVHVVPYLVDEHGLRQYPGPFLAKFTDFWLFWVASKSRRTDAINELHQKYGPFVRIAPNHVSVVSPGAISAVYGHSTGTMKSAFYDAFLSLRAVCGIFHTRSRTEHSRKRRVMAHMFSPQSVRAFEPRVKGHLQTLLNQWDVMCSKVGAKDEVKAGTLGSSTWEVHDGYVWFDVRFWCNLFTFDVIGELAFGSPFDMLLRGEDTAKIAKSAKAGMASYGLTDAAKQPVAQYEVEEIAAIELVTARTEFVPALAVLPAYMREFMKRMPQYHRGGKALGQMIGMAADVVSRRLAAARDAENDAKIFDDMFGRLLNGRDENGNPMSPQELTAEAITLLIAGSDTTSNSMSAIIFYISRDQKVQKKLQAELDAAASADTTSILPFDDAKSLPYLEAVVNEGLRLFSPVGLGLGRVVPEGGITVLGQNFPAGTEISVPLYSVHHLEEVWGADVEKYLPERWLNAEKRGEMMKAFNPFSFGPRACIGRNVAMLEITLVIAAVFRRYDIVVQPGQVLEVHDNFVRKPHKFVVGIKRRDI